MPDPPKFTPTEQRLMSLMRDGLRHDKEELRGCLRDGYVNGPTALKVHMTAIRKKVNPLGLEIICEFNRRKIHYRLVRLISQDT